MPRSCDQGEHGESVTLQLPQSLAHHCFFISLRDGLWRPEVWPSGGSCSLHSKGTSPLEPLADPAPISFADTLPGSLHPSIYTAPLRPPNPSLEPLSHLILHPTTCTLFSLSRLRLCTSPPALLLNAGLAVDLISTPSTPRSGSCPRALSLNTCRSHLICLKLVRLLHSSFSKV